MDASELVTDGLIVMLCPGVAAIGATLVVYTAGGGLDGAGTLRLASLAGPGVWGVVVLILVVCLVVGLLVFALRGWRHRQ